jgi:hypothetical protein
VAPSDEDLPTGHAMHDVWAFRLEYRPAGQLMQTILELPYFPAGQDPQELAPSPLIFPAGQYSHWLVLDENLPAGQLSHLVDPEEEEIVPAPHELQLSWPLELW